MSSFYTEEELKNIGFKSYGKNVLISKKASIYRAQDIEIGNHVRIDDFCFLLGKIVIGNYVHIAPYSNLVGGREGIFMDDYSGVSSRVSIYAVSDDYSGMAMTNPTVPAEFTNVIEGKVYLGKHVIIGATSVVLPGVTLAEGSSFGSFSFINRDSDPWSMNRGIPSKRVGDRSKKPIELEKKLKEKE